MRTNSVLADDARLSGEVARTFRFRALSGETVTVGSTVELKLVAWSASMMFVRDGNQYGLQAGPHGFGEGAMLLPGMDFTAELSVAGGRLHAAKVPSRLADLSPRGRAHVEDVFAKIRNEGGEVPDRLTVNGSKDWVGYWTDAGRRFDLVLSGTDWTRVEQEALFQLSAFDIAVDDFGIGLRPSRSARRLSVFGSHLMLIVPPLGLLKVLPRREARGLLPARQAALPLRHGSLRRMTLGEAGTDDREEMLVFSNRTAIGVVRDPRFTDLDQSERLAAVSDLNLTWSWGR